MMPAICDKQGPCWNLWTIEQVIKWAIRESESASFYLPASCFILSSFFLPASTLSGTVVSYVRLFLHRMIAVVTWNSIDRTTSILDPLLVLHLYYAAKRKYLAKKSLLDIMFEIPKISFLLSHESV